MHEHLANMSLSADVAEQRSPSPAKSSAFWNIAQKLKRNQSFESLRGKASLENIASTFARSSIETVRSDNSASQNSFRAKKPRRPLVTIPETDISHKPRKDSGYGSADFSACSSTNPSLPRFSWQKTVEEHQQRDRTRPRHVAIVIPDYAQPIIDPLKSGNSVISNFPDFPPPPTGLPPVPSSSRPRSRRDSTTSTIKANKKTTSKMTAAGLEQSFSSGPQLQLRDPSTADFPSVSSGRPSMSRGTSYASLATTEDMPPEPTVANMSSVSAEMASRTENIACNVWRTTGTEPGPLTGAATTILGDKLYVIGGRHISGRQEFVRLVYELDLVRRHWTALETQGDRFAPRYFHTVCPIGDTKLISYGGLSPGGHNIDPKVQSSHAKDLAVMSDVCMFDVVTQTWTIMTTLNEAPEGRYAHCASVVPSTSFFTSTSYTDDSANGRGGAELVIAGGQDKDSKYISQISIFNLRSRTWTSTTPLAGDFGAYKSVLATLTNMTPEEVGSQRAGSRPPTGSSPPAQAPLLFYSNYNFVDVRIDFKVGTPTIQLRDIALRGQRVPPGLRFPTCGIHAGHLIIGGTVINSDRQEYHLWSLNLKTLIWSRIDVDRLTTGSWNRGMLWKNRNIYVVIGNRKRKQGVDYQSRRLNFTHVCTVELDVFGLHENSKPRLSTVNTTHIMNTNTKRSSLESVPGFSHAESTGRSAIGIREIADMDIHALGGEKIPVNSAILASRWGPYFQHLVEDSAAHAINISQKDFRMSLSPSEASTVRPNMQSRLSSTTITPSMASTRNSTHTDRSSKTVLPDSAVGSISEEHNGKHASMNSTASTLVNAAALTSRMLYLPHTVPTIRALLFYLYTLTLPPSNTQILTSLLQIASIYHIPNLLEAVTQRLHDTLTASSVTDVFHATALAAGDGTNVTFIDAHGNAGEAAQARSKLFNSLTTDPGPRRPPGIPKRDGTVGLNLTLKNRTLSEQASFDSTTSSSSNISSASESSTATDASGDTDTSDASDVTTARRLIGDEEEKGIWKGEISTVIGLQKRALRGIYEGRWLQRERERMAKDRMVNGGEPIKGRGLGFGVEEGESG
jgi:hypothetical protein